MEFVYGFIIVLVISYYIQKLCIKAKKKIVKMIPVICVVGFAVMFAVESYESMHGGDFFWFHFEDLFGYYLGPLVLMAFFAMLLAGAVLGVAMAWIVYAIKYMVQKRKE